MTESEFNQLKEQFVAHIRPLATRLERVEAAGCGIPIEWANQILQLKQQLADIAKRVSVELEAETERERVQRWNDTYNAVAPALITLQLPNDMVREEAAKFADLAHGPLQGGEEATLPTVNRANAGSSPAPAAEQQQQTSDVPLEWQEQVIALVRAARDVLDVSAFDGPWERALRSALKPFDGVTVSPNRSG